MFTKRTLKLMYNLKVNKHFTCRQIAREIKRRNLNSLSIEIISSYIAKTFPSYDGKTIYSQYELSVLMRWYSSARNTDKIISYFNSRFHRTITKGYLLTLMSKANVQKNNRKRLKSSYITEKDRTEIVRLYRNGMKVKEITDLYGFKTTKSILDILHDFNIDVHNDNIMHHSNCDIDFTYVDSYFKGYFLGLLLTDGYIMSKHNGIGLDLCDSDCIDFICKTIRVNSSFIKASKTQHKNKYRISIFGKKHVVALKRLSVIPKKSLILKGPNLNDNELQFIPAIIRGIIDGDGWIRKDGKEFFICTASYEFAQWIKLQLENLNMVSLNVKCIHNDYYHDIYHIRTALQRNIQILRNIIYPYPFGMQRKYVRCHQL